MKISLIIPTYNAASYLPTLLESLKQQSIDFECIIIDSSSWDETVTLLTPYADTIIRINKDEFDHGGTRTKAAKIASGEILIYLTQDATPVNIHSFKTLIQAFDNPHVAAAYGRQLPYPKTNLFGTHLRLFNYPKLSYVRTLKDKSIYGIKTTFLSDSFAAYRKSSMQEVFYFKENLIVGEDSYIGAKLLLKGYSLAYVSEAMVYHSHTYTPFQECQRYFDIGVFHQQESWLLETFGKPEGEGMRYIKSEFSYLLTQHAYVKIPEFILRNGLKFLGYKLGKFHFLLPSKLIQKLSMHPQWWK